MKRFLLFLLLSSSSFSLFATDYYSQAGQTDPNTLASWNELQGGGGAAPVSFTNVADRFIIQIGHSMTTTATWNVSTIVIQNGGNLRGNHVIPLSGIFHIDAGGTYIHSNAASVLQTAGMSIFSGTESFATTSNFEIRDWNNLTSEGAPLPNSPVIIWGNLTVDIREDVGGIWNWGIEDGATLTIAGNLVITRKHFCTCSSFELRITGSGVQTVNVGGNFTISDVIVAMKKTDISPVDGYTTMQVNGSIIVGYSTLDLGINTTYPTPVGLYELRFKGRLGIWRSNLKSTSTMTCLVANGNDTQNAGWHFTSSAQYDFNLRIAPGATVNLGYNFGALNRTLTISGTLNQQGWGLEFSKVEVAGGTLNADTLNSYYHVRGSLGAMDNCTVCTGNGSFDNANNTWCATSGIKGVANISSTRFSANSLNAGHTFLNSPGDIFFTNSDANTNGYTVNPKSIFSIDENSYAEGSNAGFNGNGGTLRIGSTDGITATGNTSTGNIRVGSNKNYDNAGINNFEYFGTNPQVTGNGLPGTIDGVLKINNTSDAGAGANVTLSQPTTITGSVDLTKGKLLNLFSCFFLYFREKKFFHLFLFITFKYNSS
jgi:hypothetical protein